MNMKKSFKRFWTMQKHTGGFTLVELIVVIAILAILAGIGIPAYSGYIAKADRAGDETLLSAVNRAYAAACVEEGVDILKLTATSAVIKINKDTGLIASVKPNGANENVAAGFAEFYKENENTPFKVITSLVFDEAKYAFVDIAGVSNVTVSYAGSKVTVSAEALLALQDSTYGDIGSNALLEKVDLVTDIAAGMAGTKLQAVFADDDFTAAAMLALGATSEADYQAKSAAIINKLVNEYGMSPQNAINQINANAAVLYASQNAVKFTDDQIKSLFSGDFKSSSITANLKQDGKTAEGMAQATLVYGMYTAYANQPGNEHLKATTDDPLAVLRALDNDEKFRAFALSDQGKTDMEAFQSALGVIVDCTKNNEQATTDLMINGYDNTELKDVIGNLMG